MTSTVPCQAKDPNTCKYHGAANRMSVALRAGNMDAYLKASDDLAAAAKDTPEVVDFFAKKSQHLDDQARRPHYNRGEAQGLKAIKHWAKGKIAVGQDDTTPTGYHYAEVKTPWATATTYLLDSDENGNPNGIVGRIERSRGKITAYQGNSLQGGKWLGAVTDTADSFQKIVTEAAYRLPAPANNR